jgi:hypothetical protein
MEFASAIDLAGEKYLIDCNLEICESVKLFCDIPNI